MEIEDKLVSVSNHKDESIIDQNDTLSSISNGTLLGGAFLVRGKVESLKHGDIYDVNPVAQIGIDMKAKFQARVFHIEGQPSKLQAHVYRTIRRMLGRSFLRITSGQYQVVVFKTGNVGDSENNNNVEAEAGGLSQPISSESTSSKRPKKKSTNRKESERLRQQSRRKRNRQRKQAEKIAPQDQAAQIEPESGLSLLLDVDPDDIKFFQLINQIPAFKSLWGLSDYSPGISAYLKTRYKEAEPSDVDTITDMMKKEIAYFRRQRDKFTPIMNKCMMYISETLGANDKRRNLVPVSPKFHEQKLQKTLFIWRYMNLFSGIHALRDLIDLIEMLEREDSSLSARSIK